MNITVDAVYHGGVFRPTEPLPLKDDEKVRLTVQTVGATEAPRKARGYGLLEWTRAIEDLDYLIDDAANDPLEQP
jgi:predicted DNA-binding antitoxin AbrB/MazE fold protein